VTRIIGALGGTIPAGEVFSAEDEGPAAR